MREVWRPTEYLPMPDSHFDISVVNGELELTLPELEPTEEAIFPAAVEQELQTLEELIEYPNKTYPLLGVGDQVEIRQMSNYVKGAKRRAVEHLPPTADPAQVWEHERAAVSAVYRRHQEDLSYIGLRAQWQADRAQDFVWLLDRRILEGNRDPDYTRQEHVGLETVEAMLRDVSFTADKTKYVARKLDQDVLERGFLQAAVSGDAILMRRYAELAETHFSNKTRYFWRQIQLSLRLGQQGVNDRRSDHVKLDVFAYNLERQRRRIT